MSRIRSKDTKPEIAVRRVLHAMGYRFRLHRRDLPGRPDIVLPRHRKAVLVHGCFWHAHGCRGKLPETNAGFWSDKLRRNRERDERNILELEASGWHVIVVWECELGDPERIRKRLNEFLAYAE